MKRMFFASFLVLFCLFSLLSCDQTNKDKEKQSIYPEHKLITLYDQTINISAGNYKVYNLSPQGILYDIDFDFHIDIVSDNTIDVWVMLIKDEYSHFMNGESFEYVSSASGKKVTRFSCDFKGYGYYCLVLSNQFSLFTSKTVSVKVISK